MREKNFTSETQQKKIFLQKKYSHNDENIQKYFCKKKITMKIFHRMKLVALFYDEIKNMTN